MAAKLTPGRGRPASLKGRKGFIRRMIAPALGSKSPNKAQRLAGRAATRYVLDALDEPMGFAEVEAWLRFLQQALIRDYVTPGVDLEARDFFTCGAKIGAELAKVVALREQFDRPQLPSTMTINFAYIAPDGEGPDDDGPGDILEVA